MACRFHSSLAHRHGMMHFVFFCMATVAGNTRKPVGGWANPPRNARRAELWAARPRGGRYRSSWRAARSGRVGLREHFGLAFFRDCVFVLAQRFPEELAQGGGRSRGAGFSGSRISRGTKRAAPLRHTGACAQETGVAEEQGAQQCLGGSCLMISMVLNHRNTRHGGILGRCCPFKGRC